MLVPLTWLRDYVTLPDSVAELVERLTLAGLESASIRVIGRPVPAGIRVKADDAGLVWERDQIVLAKVLKIEKHPDADKLKLVTVDYGQAEPKTVVTGAPNIAPGESGMKVILGLRGCRYFTTDKDGKKATVTLEPKALRGIMNDAMCMSNFELGIADDHDGIILLDDNDPAPGTPIQDVLGDIVIELDVLPNMARCLAMLGVAREVAALTGAQVCEPSLAVPTIAESAIGRVNVVIENPKLCARYSATLLRNASTGAAPRWMRSRLLASGMRPISAVVDITNYVMLEFGQPLHAFDFDVLVKRAGGTTPTIVVRSAKPGETLTTLDQVERTLGPDDLVIADSVGPIALAGVMGGLDTEVTATTKAILLESAAFDFVSVRKTARQFNLFSEASTRFSKGVPAALVPLAAARAAQLLQKHAGAEVLAGTVEQYPTAQVSVPIELNRSEIGRLLGFDIPDGQVERILLALQFQLEPTLWGWRVTPPATRLDLQSGPADLIEELARVSGYDQLPERLLATEMPTPVGNRRLNLEQKLQDRLVDFGLTECIAYSFTSIDAERKLDPGLAPAAAEYVTLLNPISPERSVLRRSLVPGLLEIAVRNLASTESVALFELGSVFHPDSTKLPKEPQRLAIVLSGRRTATAWDDDSAKAPAALDFYDLKGILVRLGAELHLPPLTFEPTKLVPHLHPGRAATMLLEGNPMATFGELHPTVAKAFGLADRAVLAADIDAEALLAAVPERYAYRPFNTLPAAKRDVAVIVPEELPMDRVLAELQAAGGELLTGAELFDVYRGDSIPAGTKSLAFALTYQPKEKTLTDKEIDKAHQKIESRLVHVLKAQIRGK